ncbi:MAG: GtrA family protein [Nanoarchaeota archaeon]
MKKTLKQFLGYVVIAGLATLLDIFILFFLTEKIGLWYFYSSIISFVSASIPNFMLNKYFNFKNKDKRLVQQYGVWFCISIVGLILTQMFMFIFVEYFKIYFLLAKCLTIMMVIFWDFFGNKSLTFNSNFF